MYGYEWVDKQNDIFRLDVSIQFQKDLRPVFKEELDFLEMNKVWEYPDTDLPLLWAEGIRKYIVEGSVVGDIKGGTYYEKPTVELKTNDKICLKPIDIDHLYEVNKSLMNGLVQRAINFIKEVYEKYSSLGYIFSVAFSGGKDSIALLDLVQRALSPDQFVVIFGDTGMELSDTYMSFERAQKHYPTLKFYKAKSTTPTIESWKLRGPPGRKMRWCCSVHKSVPSMLKLKEIYGQYGNLKVVVFDGIRAEESVRRSHYTELSAGKHTNQINCSPLLQWNTAELYLYVLSRGILFNDAYRKGCNRVGCSICPLAANWRDSVCNHIYPDELAPLLHEVEVYGRNMGVSEKDLKKYVEQGGWRSRAGGRGMVHGGNRVYETLNVSEITFHFTESTQKWVDVARLLGPIVERSESVGEQLIRGQIYNFKIDFDPNLVVTYKSTGKLSRDVISALRGVANKVAYCNGCNACVVECPVDALTVNENSIISVDDTKCIHCFKCISEVEKGCVSAWCLSTTLGGNNMKFIGMNRYTTFGFRESFLTHFFNLKNDCWGSQELGNLQYAALKVWLKESNIIEVNSQTDKNGQITELGNKLMNLGPHNPDSWAIILANLAYNSSLIKWYLLCVDFSEEPYEKADYIFLIGDDYSERQRENAVSSLCETLNKSPIGSRLGLGIPIKSGKNTVYLKKGWDDPNPLIILYTMFLYAEKLDGHYITTLNELKKIRDSRPSDFIGMDPVTIFGINETDFKDMLFKLSIEYPDYIKVEFVSDLTNIKLSSDKTSNDVIDLLLEGN